VSESASADLLKLSSKVKYLVGVTEFSTASTGSSKLEM